MDAMAKSQSTNSKIKEAFDKRVGLSNFIENIKSAVTPDLGADAYEINNRFASQVESAIKILANNPDTKTVSLSTSGLGGWDDHDDARNYVTRANLLFKTLKSGIAHLKALAKENNICIMVFSEFGRNVNLNSAFGWDHGNLQNFYLLGGKNYFTHRGVVGETLVDDDGRINRLYLKPTPSSYSFEHISIAATIIMPLKSKTVIQ